MFGLGYGIMTRRGGLLFCLNRLARYSALVMVSSVLFMGCGTQMSPPEDRPESRGLTGIDSNERIPTFRRAKHHVYALFKKRLRTFYCDCAYSKRLIHTARCSFKSSRHQKRAGRTEIEHVVPAHAFGQSFKSWREGHPKCVDRKGRRFRGRRCAKAVSKRFERMSADLYNLRPVVGAVNALRSNLRMGLVDGESRVFGQCDVEIANGTFEPRASIRGDIARIYFYMDAAYPGHGIVGKKQRKLFEAWHAADPVSEEERQLAQQIKAIQGNDNPFVNVEGKAD